jgi:hypothetical protein
LHSAVAPFPGVVEAGGRVRGGGGWVGGGGAAGVVGGWVGAGAIDAPPHLVRIVCWAASSVTRPEQTFR